MTDNGEAGHQLNHQPHQQPIAQSAYDQLAAAYANRIETKPHNAYYDRPAMLSLLPDVVGKRVLDAGCGPGVYAEILVEMGAEVVALDGNEKMVTLARSRLGERVQVYHANLEAPLDYLDDAFFDIVLAPLVLDYIYDWRTTFAEFNRVLKLGGALVFSIEHPVMKYFDHRAHSHYFKVEQVSYTWRGFGPPVEVPSYRRSLGETINPLIESGFFLDTLLEPLPTEAFKEQDPEGFEQLLREPCFLCVRAIKNFEV